MGFLGSKDETFGPARVDQTPNPLEPHMDVSFATHTVGLRHAADHLGGDQGLDYISVFGQIASLLAFRDHIVGQEHAELVSVERRPRGIGLKCPRARTSHPIAIRIGGQGDVGLDALGVLHDCVEDCRVFRVADVTRDVREISVGSRMRPVFENLGKTRRSEQFRDDKSPDAMQGRVDDFRITGAGPSELQGGISEFLIDLLRDKPHLAFGYGLIKIYTPDLLDVHYPVDDLFVMRR